MIATIVFGMLAVIFIAVTIIEWKTYGTLYFMVFPVSFIILWAFMFDRGYGHEYAETKKKELIFMYESFPSEKALKDIFQYNEKVNDGNNIFCRFKVEDRSEWYIDIDELMKGEKKHDRRVDLQVRDGNR